MSVKMMTATYEAAFPDIDVDGHNVKASTSKAVCLALADHANDDGKGAYPAIETLCNKTEYERRTVQRALDALILMGVAKLVGVSEYRTDNYTVNWHTLNMMKRKKEGDSGADYQTSSQAEGDSGAGKGVPESPEPSLKPSIKKLDLVDAVIEYQLKPKAIQDAMRDFFKLTPNWEKKDPRDFMQWAMGEKVTTEQIEFAANVYRSDKRFNWKIPDLKGIAEHWLELIESYRPKQAPTQPESDGGFRV